MQDAPPVPKLNINLPMQVKRKLVQHIVDGVEGTAKKLYVDAPALKLPQCPADDAAFDRYVEALLDVLLVTNFKGQLAGFDRFLTSLMLNPSLRRTGSNEIDGKIKKVSKCLCA